ncbi:hypothetical protein GCM10023186_26070 [Hymenobacter koreensis]|uniref:Secretion system C-terminal sorting domain-containing protein n=1 Tax=Hymenobacter koreensis TaxID=1084523 RepID=A0ABP8J3R5_9BACT
MGTPVYGTGTTTGTGNFVVFSGPAASPTEITVTGLTYASLATSGHVIDVYAYNQDGVAPVTNYRQTSPATRAFAALPTYTWNAATTTIGDFTTASNWTPNRAAPSANDALVFNRTSLTEIDRSSNAGVPAQGQVFGQLYVVNNANVTIYGPGNANREGSLVIGNNSTEGDDFVTEGGSSLNLTSGANTDNRPAYINIASGATASIGGTFAMNAASGGSTIVPHRFFAEDAGAIRFISGSVYNGQSVVGFPFGTTGSIPAGNANTSGDVAAAANSVTFESGSRFEHRGGLHPFGNGASNVTSFLAGSTYVYIGGTFSSIGQQYGNLEFQASATVSAPYNTPNLIILNNLTVTSGVVALNVNGQGSLNGTLIYGNLAVNGGSLSFAPSVNSAVFFLGNAEQFISGNAPLSFSTNVVLGIVNASGVTLQRPVISQGSLYLDKGLLNTSATNILSIPATSAVIVVNGSTNLNNTSFVNGPMTRVQTASGLVATDESNGTGLFFPIGERTFYRPVTLTINQTSALSTGYTAEAVRGEPAARTLGGDIQRVSRVRYYNLTSSGASAFTAGRIKLYYGPDDEVDAPSKLRIALGNASAWENLGFSAPVAADGTVYLTGSITSSNPFAALGTFVLASTIVPRTHGDNPLPVSLASLNADSKKDGVMVSWSTASEKNNDRFEIQCSINGGEFQTVGSVKGAGNSASLLRYNYLDLTSATGTLYYRLRQVDTDGTATLSGVVAVKKAETLVASVYPNPARKYTRLQAGAEPVQWRLLTLQGRSLSSGTAAGDTRIELQNLPAGTYLLEINRAGQRSVQKVVHLN